MGRKKYSIAILEDERVLLKYLASSFEHEKGFTVFTASDGEAGEALVKKEKPDLVLLDIIMPKKNGFEVLESLKKDPKTKHIPVIVLSNLGQKSDIVQAKKLGAADYFVKVDMEVKEIIDEVKDFLAQ